MLRLRQCPDEVQGYSDFNFLAPLQGRVRSDGSQADHERIDHLSIVKHHLTTPGPSKVDKKIVFVTDPDQQNGCQDPAKEQRGNRVPHTPHKL